MVNAAAGRARDEASRQKTSCGLCSGWMHAHELGVRARAPRPALRACEPRPRRRVARSPLFLVLAPFTRSRSPTPRSLSFRLPPIPLRSCLSRPCTPSSHACRRLSAMLTTPAAQHPTAHPPRTSKRRLSDAGHPSHDQHYDHDDGHDDQDGLPMRSKRTRPHALGAAAEIGAAGVASTSSSSSSSATMAQTGTGVPQRALSEKEKEQRRVARMIRNRSASRPPPLSLPHVSPLTPPPSLLHRLLR